MFTVNVKHGRKEGKIQLKEGSTVKLLLKKLGVNPETVLVGRAGEIILESEKLQEGDSVELIRVISGG